jgi:DNA-binding NarL/FixJ family response regulator
MVTVAIIEDQAMVSEALQIALSLHSDIDVLGAVTNLGDGTVLVARCQPDVVILDYRLPDGVAPDGIALIRGARHGVAILVISAEADYDMVVLALAAGANGFLLKDQRMTELVDAVRLVHAGGRPLAPQLVSALVSRLTGTNNPAFQLSRRETEVLRYLAQGMSTRELGAVMQLSLNTVRNHVQSAIRRLGAHSKLEAVAIARREGIIGDLHAAS